MKSQILTIAFRYANKGKRRTIVTIWRNNGTVGTYRNTARRFDAVLDSWPCKDRTHSETKNSIIFNRRH